MINRTCFEKSLCASLAICSIFSAVLSSNIIVFFINFLYPLLVIFNENLIK